MKKDLVGAEVVPQAGKSVEAAKALQTLGFKVLHIGNTSISVQAAEADWRKHFKVAFESRSKSQLPLAPAKKTAYRQPKQGPIAIPDALRELVESVQFVEPPTFF